MTHVRTLLVVDDDNAFRTRLMVAFERRGFDVRGAGDAESALVLVLAQKPELAVIDQRMPGRSGLDLIREVKRISPGTKIVLLTGYASGTIAEDAVRAGASRCLVKPLDADEILSAFDLEG